MKPTSQTGRAKQERTRRFLASLGLTRHHIPLSPVQRMLVDDLLHVRERIKQARSKQGKQAARDDDRLTALSVRLLDMLSRTRHR